MRTSVALAVEARRRFLSATAGTKPRRPIRIALSLGPYGATLSPGQEYGGVYPPPYGPQAYTSSDTNRISFSPQEISEGREAQAVDALAAFHLARLRVFAEDPETWDVLDMLAFETIPLPREMLAVRKAVATLRAETRVRNQPFWISAVFPSGRFPEAREENTSHCMQLLCAAAFNDDLNLAQPAGIGINCTPPSFVGGLVEEMRQHLVSLAVAPWLVLYPNGGGIYDPLRRTWGEDDTALGETGSWAVELASIARREEASGIWSGVVVGGCCKTTPNDIRALAHRLGYDHNA
jgi:homocysteine S-methyltransferase